mmetsp:Transcript_2777/g.5793  ORF Transcript_2777/g.5793 Transcript_2777/m.5793 type:complete len:242 (-) Transcript_2777:3443-4168(-)
MVLLQDALEPLDLNLELLKLLSGGSGASSSVKTGPLAPGLEALVVLAALDKQELREEDRADAADGAEDAAHGLHSQSGVHGSVAAGDDGGYKSVDRDLVDGKHDVLGLSKGVVDVPRRPAEVAADEHEDDLVRHGEKVPLAGLALANLDINEPAGGELPLLSGGLVGRDDLAESQDDGLGGEEDEHDLERVHVREPDLLEVSVAEHPPDPPSLGEDTSESQREETVKEPVAERAGGVSGLA